MDKLMRNLIPLNSFEYDMLVSSLSGPCCVAIHDGDYDYAEVAIDGTAVSIEVERS